MDIVTVQSVVVFGRRTDCQWSISTANHTLAVDASNPFVPMGTKVVMNGVEYTVEDTGAFARYGVQFDVYYDSHAAASAHGHQDLGMLSGR